MRPFARLILNAPSAPAPAAGAEVGAELVALVTRALRGHRRRGGGVDYAALRTSDAWREAETCAGRLRALDLRSLEPYPARLAFWLNVYNALVLHGIVALGLERSVRETWNFFGRVGYRVGAFALSADEIEHGLLRGNRARKLPPWPPFRADDARLALACQPPDPRIHFALNCGARSCPPVRVYRAEVVDAQLDTAARSFINQEVSLQPDGRIACSRVFKWYRRDFPAGEGLRAFLLRYLDDGPVRAAVAAGARLCHTLRPYSWALSHSVGTEL